MLIIIYYISCFIDNIAKGEDNFKVTFSPAFVTAMIEFASLPQACKLAMIFTSLLLAFLRA